MMSDEQNTLFERRKAGTDCLMCPDGSAGDVIATLPSGNVHLLNDAEYPGYCVLVLRRHAAEIYDLTPDERAQWIADIAHVSQAIADVCQPVKLNTAWLGNAVPHLHCHIRPRYYHDPVWPAAPGFAPPTRPLLPEEYARLRDRLTEVLRFLSERFRMGSERLANSTRPT